MKDRTILFTLMLCFLLVAGCQSCSDETTPETDGGSDSESSTNTDTETTTETTTETETDTVDPYDRNDPPGVWIDFPEGEDCGPGCTQVTFTEEIREYEWDIWGDYLVYVDKDKHRIYVSDVKSKKIMALPDVHEEHPITGDISSPAIAMSPTIFENSIYYHLGIFNSEPGRDEIISMDLETKNQTVIWKRDYLREDGSDEGWYAPTEMDAHGANVVVQAATGNPLYRTLGVLHPPWPTEGDVIIDDFYGGNNSIWDDVIVYLNVYAEPLEVVGYDLNKKTFFKVSDYNSHKSHPRIQGNRVVYMDYRHSDGNPFDSWKNVVVFSTDLVSKEHTQITSGDAIAASPDIFDDIVIWRDYRHCSNPQEKQNLSNTELYGYNLTTKKEFRITNIPGRPKATPRIWGERVFVDMQTPRGSEIFMFELPEGAK